MVRKKVHCVSMFVYFTLFGEKLVLGEKRRHRQIKQDKKGNISI